MSHTPAPWVWSDRHNSLYSTTPPAEMVLDSAPYEGMWLAYNDHTEDNALLIAAAPELLEALKGTLFLFEQHAVTKTDLEQIAFASAAIAKATGKS